MEQGGLSVRHIYIILVLVIAVLALGCVGQKKTDYGTSTNTSVTTPAAVAPNQVINNGENDLFGTETDIAQLDSWLNESSSMDISLAEI